MSEEKLEPEPAPIVPAQAQAVALFGTMDPDAVLSKAITVATSLKSVLQRAGLIKSIQGKDFPLVEAWTTLGAMVGVFAVATEQYEIPKDEGAGFRVYVEARRGGQVIGGAWGECSRLESMWSKRDRYALLAMAQTRATSRALRQPLGWVMKLAGVEATAAEEMPSEGDSGSEAGRSPAGGEGSPVVGTAASPVRGRSEGKAAGGAGAHGPGAGSPARSAIPPAPKLPPGELYYVCPNPTCRAKAVRVGLVSGDAYCWPRAGGCGKKWTAIQWQDVQDEAQLDKPPLDLSDVFDPTKD